MTFSSKLSEALAMLMLLLMVAHPHHLLVASAFPLVPSFATSTLLPGTTTGGIRDMTPSGTRLQSAATRLSESELLDLISDDAYAMDITSITEGSEKETYIGQGSGVNEGTGIGTLSAWLQTLVGKLLTWKNRPIYEKLWTVIEDDLLAMVQQRTPELAPRRTFFSDSVVGPHSFATDDGMCDGTVAAYKGGKVDWLTTCKFFSKSLGFGNMRIDGWSTRDTRAPHMAVHLCIVFNVIFIYISLVPRANLLLDDEYNDYGKLSRTLDWYYCSNVINFCP